MQSRRCFAYTTFEAGDRNNHDTDSTGNLLKFCTKIIQLTCLSCIILIHQLENYSLLN